MFPKASKSGGQTHFIYPDVCKTPAPPAPFVPVPYPPSAPPLGGAKRSRKTKVTGNSVSKFTVSSGDEAATQGGRVLSYRLQTLGFSKQGAMLMVQGKPVVMASDQSVLRGILSGSNQLR
jgi:hypothetical protein